MLYSSLLTAPPLMAIRAAGAKSGARDCRLDRGLLADEGKLELAVDDVATVGGILLLGIFEMIKSL